MAAWSALQRLRGISNFAVAAIIAIALAIGAASGYGLARAYPDAYEVDQSCKAAPPSGQTSVPAVQAGGPCAQPADHASQDAGWAAFGAVIAGVVVLGALRPGRIPRD